MRFYSIRNGLACLALCCTALAASAGSGTENDPYTITEALALSTGTTEYWAQGYIVGGRYDDFDSPWTADYGLSCADTDSETDVNNCLQVKLESDGGRTTWGLGSNPGHYQKRIKFRGKRDTYGGYPSFESINNADISEVSASTQLPEFDVNPGPVSATVSVAVAFSVSATGSPEPDLALAGTTASDGYSFTAGTGELNYTPSTNDFGAQTFTFTASNSAGVATQVVSVSVSNALVSAPVFDAIGTQSALVETPINFTVSATGYPVPDLALDTATASGGYSFTAGTGELNYTPSTNDFGTQTFTFTASNSAGVATQMVNVVVSLVPVILEPPASVWASDTHSTDFTAAWSASAGATGYRLDVSTSATFSGGGMGAGSRTNDCVVSGGSSYDTRSWIDGNTVPWTAYKARTDETVNGNPSICLQNAAGAYVVSEGIPNGIGGLSFDVQQKYSGSGGELTVYVNGSQVGTFAYGETVQTATFVDIDVETVASLVVSNNGAVRLAINNLVWSDYGASAASYVPGYSNLTVNGTSQSVTGLTENTDYYFRVR
ncbi:MAG: DUF6359 domain-containing protein, partial [Kiritimatiellia bacterium]|nr:DUF6359 domain-containing protein [Kiritimatiellia bacterium]